MILGDYFKGSIRLWDVTGLWCFAWGFSCWLGKVEMDRSGVLSCPFALGLYDVVAWHGSIVNDCARDVLLLCRKEQHFMPWL